MVERTSKLTVSMETEGGEKIKALVAELRQLASGGGEAAPEMERLANEIEQLDKARVAANAFTELRNAAVELGAKLLNEEQALSRLRTTLSEAKNSTAEFAQKQTNTARELDAAKQAVIDTTANLKALRAEMKNAAGGTAEMIERERQLATELKESKAAIKEKKDALSAANKELTAAGKAECEHEAEVAKAEKSIGRLNTELGKQQAQLKQSRLEAQAAGVATKTLAAEQERLKGAMASAIASADAQKNSLQGAKEKAEQLALAAKRAADSLDNSFRVVGVRSTSKIKSEISEIQQSLMRLANNSKTSGAEFDRAFAAGTARIEKLRKELAGVSPEADKAAGSVGGIANSFKGLMTAYAGLELAKKFIEANVELQRNERTLRNVTGSAESAAKTMLYLRETAGRLGVDVNSLAHTYVQLAASMKNSSMGAGETQAVFTSVANAMAAVGASSYQTERAFIGLAQMASKGVVSMEELRQQVGEALPGALQAAAKGLGITERELVSLVSSGKLLTEDFFPAFRRGLDDTFSGGTKKVEGFEQTWNRFKQSLTDTSTYIGQTGVLDAMVKVLEWGTTVVRGFTAAIELSGRELGAYYGMIASFDWKHPIESLRRYGEESKAILDDVAEKYTKAQDAANGVADAQANVADKVGATAGAMDAGVTGAQSHAAAMTASANASTANANAQNGTAAAATKNAAAQTAAGNATQAAGNQAAEAGSKWVQIQVMYDKAIASAEQNTKIATNLAEAKSAEGKSIVVLAQLSGSETAARDAATNAANNNYRALLAVSEARAAEAANVRGMIVALEQEALAHGGLTTAKEAELKKLRETLELKESELVKSQEVRDAARLEAEQARVTAEVYKDNASKLYEYKNAANQAEVEVRKLEVAERLGKATQDQVNEARLKAASALALYRDALKDAVAHEEIKLKQMERTDDLSQRRLQVDAERLKSAEAIARAEGREADAVEYSNRQKQIAIQIAREKADALTKEADQMDAVANKMEAEAQANGTLNEAKKDEIQARRDAAEARRLEAELANENVRQLQAEAEAAKETAKTLAELSDERKKYKNNDKTDFEYQMAGAANIDFEGAMYKRGLSVDEVKAAMQYVNDAFKQTMITNPITDGLFAGDRIAANMQRAIDEAIRLSRTKNESSSYASSSSGSASTPTVSAGSSSLMKTTPLQSTTTAPLVTDNTQSSSGQPVTININGSANTLTVGSSDDVATLERVLRQLTTSAART